MLFLALSSLVSASYNLSSINVIMIDTTNGVGAVALYSVARHFRRWLSPATLMALCAGIDEHEGRPGALKYERGRDSTFQPLCVGGWWG